ncbi:hypothetical protein C8J56DRAFT_1053907 [Mycena floridula]|nr:hypothetical protein C8J56DRAFT_1053907 [Mycena floridula]
MPPRRLLRQTTSRPESRILSSPDLALSRASRDEMRLMFADMRKEEERTLSAARTRLVLQPVALQNPLYKRYGQAMPGAPLHSRQTAKSCAEYPVLVLRQVATTK